jgi:hypothetical protein
MATGLAHRAVLSEWVVHSHERDKRTPRPATLAKLARVLGPGLLGTARGGKRE